MQSIPALITWAGKCMGPVLLEPDPCREAIFCHGPLLFQDLFMIV